MIRQKSIKIGGMLCALLYSKGISAEHPTRIYEYRKDNKFVIGAHPPRGFFGCFLGALSNLYWCSDNKIKPYIYWDKSSLYYEEDGFNGETENVWEYYFEQVSRGTFDKKALQWSGFRNPSGGLIKGIYKPDAPCFTCEFRADMHKIIEKYIVIKPDIEHKIHLFFEQHMMGKHTIGLHLRGTDKPSETKQVQFSEIFATANACAERYHDCQFFVATDEWDLLEMAKNALNGPVIFYDSYRSHSKDPIHFHAPGYSKAKLGEEVLIEVMLLSLCTEFVHTISNISLAVLYFNPTMPHTLLRTQDEPW